MTPEAANFHVVTRQLRACAQQDGFGALPDFHRVVGHQPMAANDEVQRAFALADAALSHYEHAEPENVEQHAVNQLAHHEAVFEDRRELRDGGGCGHLRP
jgi:hypothetical protein